MSATTRTIPPPKSSAAAPASVAAPKPKPKMTDEIRRKLGIPLRPTPSPSRPNSGNPAPVPFQKPKMTDENRRRLDKHNRDAALAAIKNIPKPVRPINPAAAGDPTPLVSGAAPGNLTAGDPQSIQDTIKKMKCTVCQSQGIISKALGTTLTPCNSCVRKGLPLKQNQNSVRLAKEAATARRAEKAAAASTAAASAATPAVPRARPEVPPGFEARAANINARARRAFGLGEGQQIVEPFNLSTLPGLPAAASAAAPSATSGGRRSRRRHRKTSRRTKNKRSTRRR